MTFCAEYSRESQEQLFGTAKPVDLWLLIEHPGSWEKEAAKSLPSVAREAVERLQVRFPRMRLGLIRQKGRTSRPLAGFLALSREKQSQLFPFSIDRHEDLAALDFDGMLEGRPSERELLLVCTHGAHDRCCAKFGSSLMEAMRRAQGDDVWQVSHVGGCRFAPNMVSLPQGVVYGRVQVSDSQSIAGAAQAGRVILRLLRGRSCYERPVQAAEYFLRSELGEAGELRLESAGESDGEWNVMFDCGGNRISLRLAIERTGIFTFKSCSAEERSPRTRFRLMDCRPDAGYTGSLATNSGIGRTSTNGVREYSAEVKKS